MATVTTTTRNLKLRLTPGLTTDAQYNLNRIDLAVGNQIYQALTGVTYLRAVGDIAIEPNSADIGGSGVGGTVSIGTSTHTISALNIYALSTTLNGDTIVTCLAPQTVSNKTFTSCILDGSVNTLTNIAYSALVLTGQIVNADVAASAAIAYGKLNLSDSITNADLATDTKKTLTGTANRVSVIGGAGSTLANVTLDIDTNLLPSPLGADASKVLIATGANTATWQPVPSAHDPVTIGTANGLSLITQQLSLGTASVSTTGALTSTDWSTFNSKQNTLTLGNLIGTTNRTAVTGGTGALIGSGASVDINTDLLPSPVLADIGKALIATGANASAWQVVTGITDQFVKITATDTTAGYLGAKVVAGTGIALATLGGGGVETLQVTCDLTIDELLPAQAANADKVLSTNGTTASWSDELKNKAITGGSILDVNATIATITGATYTLLATDNCKVLKFTNSGAITVTLPNSFAAGFQCSLMQMGTGAITCVAASGATLYNSTDSYTSAGGYAVMALLVTAAASWLLMGDVVSLLLPAPVVADIGKVLVATNENQATWQTVAVSDERVKISATDTTTSYLGSKIVAGAGISLTTLNPGLNEVISIVNTGAAPSDYSAAFVVGDWTGPSIGYYTLIIEHNLNSARVEVDMWDAGNNTVLADWVRTSNDIVTVSVPAVPNLRFAGSIWIKTT